MNLPPDPKEGHKTIIAAVIAIAALVALTLILKAAGIEWHDFLRAQ